LQMLSSEEVVIHFENVSKSYVENAHFSFFRNAFSRLKSLQFFGDVVLKEHIVLKNVNFKVKKGERVGVLGRNGVGKSTMLKLINGISLPSRGKISVNGSTGGVLELGAGFNPELSGRDNIFLAGTLHGHKIHDLNKFVSQIIEMAELENFIDVPIKKYSSGMRARLGFAVSITASPDIVLLDEALAVGDASFKEKSLHLMHQYLANKTVVFVSHSEQQIRNICDRVLYLNQGVLVFDGPVEEGLQKYAEDTKQLSAKPKIELVEHGSRRQLNETPKVLVNAVRLFSKGRPAGATSFRCDERISLELLLDLVEGFGELIIKVRFLRAVVGQISQTLSESRLVISEAELSSNVGIQLDFGNETLIPSNYEVEVEVSRSKQPDSAMTSKVRVPYSLKGPRDPAKLVGIIPEIGTLRMGLSFKVHKSIKVTASPLS